MRVYTHEIQLITPQVVIEGKQEIKRKSLERVIRMLGDKNSLRIYLFSFM
jgi:hypothetical protein